MSDKAVLEAALETRAKGEPAVLATIVKEHGSVPRHAGSKMIVYPDGRIIGTIGGGEMESRVIARSRELIATGGKPEIMDFDLIDPTRGDPGVCGGQVEIFMEPLLPDPTILIIGCGHCGQALAELAHWAGFRVIVSDDRADLCNPEVIPLADEYLPVPPGEIARHAHIHSKTYIAAVTRGVPLDVEMLPPLLQSDAPYIGVMGSRRRWATAAKRLEEQGINKEKLARVYAPIGLELRAETPQEIAISIMAEIIAHHYGGDASPMKWMGNPDEADSTNN